MVIPMGDVAATRLPPRQQANIAEPLANGGYLGVARTLLRTEALL